MKFNLSCLLWIFTALSWAAPIPPKLVLQLVVDQLRGDLISQYQLKFGPHGFNYLQTHSIDYRNAHHFHANTVTCPGHATIATGTYPALHGIISNSWYDRQLKRVVYCTEDNQNSILPTPRTQKALTGSSPHHVMASTFADELVLAQAGRAFTVSLKDRAAITLAGHAGKAFWFDKQNGGFVTSHYYYPTYPTWVINWNDHYQAKKETWILSAKAENYHYFKAPTLGNHFPEFGKTFPHSLGEPTSANYYKFLSMTPLADELTANFAITLLQQEKLGLSAHKTDYLAISFSATDAIGHQFGPNSLESEDNLLRLDKTLGQLFAAIDKQVGLKNTLIILTADHGTSDSPAYLARLRPASKHSLELAAMREIIAAALAKRFNLPANALEAISYPYLYLNHQIIREHHLSVKKVSRYLAEILRTQPAIFESYSLHLSHPKQDWLMAKVDKMVFPKRSGDLYLIPPPYQTIFTHEKMVTHGTPWRYDSYVPLLFANPAFKAQRISRIVSIIDIAPTLAAIVGIRAPSAALGQPLPEVMQQFDAT